MIRDIEKDFKYFEDIILRDKNRLLKREEKLKKGLIAVERIKIVKADMSGVYKNLISSHYSKGTNMDSDEIKSNYIKAIDLMDESWSPKTWNMKFKTSEKEIVPLQQYTFSGFLDFSKMLSLGILLNIPKKHVLKLVKFIDGDEVKDLLFEFYIQHLISDREETLKESYTEYFHVNERYSLLKEIITETDKVVAQEKLKLFLDKKWYPSLKGTPMYNQHNNPHNTYVGYWCFQAAAITKIKGLDDSGYRDNKYYPKDML